MPFVQNEQKQKSPLGARIWRKANLWFDKACSIYLKVAVAVTAFSLLMQLAPRQVSKPFQEHMTEQGYDGNVKDGFFKAKEIYVYERGNYLVPFHMVGRDMINSVKGKFKPDPEVAEEKNIITGLLTGLGKFGMAPINLFTFGRHTVGSDNKKLNAGCIPSGFAPVTKRTVFIYPPEKMTAREAFSTLADMDASTVRFSGDTTKIADMFYKWVVYHECRHGDQLFPEKAQREIEADLYAFSVLDKTEKDKKSLKELKSFTIAARSYAGLAGDFNHASGVALINNDWSPENHVRQAKACEALHDWTRAALAVNREFFDQDDSIFFNTNSKRAYYLVCALLDSGTIEDRNVTDAAILFKSSIFYMGQDSSTFRVHEPDYILQASGTDLKKLKIPAFPLKPSKSPSPAAS